MSNVTKDTERMFTLAIQDVMSPEAAAVIANHLSRAHPCVDKGVRTEVVWFTNMLIAAVGGRKQASKLSNSLGMFPLKGVK